MGKNGLKTETYHKYQEGDSGAPIDRKGIHLWYFKKGFWKKRDRKKFIKNSRKEIERDDNQGME